MKNTLAPLPVQTMDLATIEQLREAWVRHEPVELGDPMLARTELPLRETFYPLGFPVAVATNSDEALSCAAESWSGFKKLFETEPLQIEICVTGDTSGLCPPTPGSRLRRHICATIADADNFGLSDLAKGYSGVCVTQSAVSHHSYFRYFYLESAAMCHIANSHTSGIHAACVELNGVGMLLCGDSGAGKSTLAYACARAGWTYITDDGSFLVNGRDDQLVVGNCKQVRFRPSSESLFPELKEAQVMRRAEVGKPSIELPTSSHPSLATSFSSHIRHVVFLNRDSGRRELVPFPVEVAKLYILQRASSLAPARNAQTRMINQLLAPGVFELHYSDLDWAIDRLAKLTREGR